MIEMMLANGEGGLLPETFHFLHVGWWILHIIAIPVVFLAGFAVGKKKGSKSPGG